MNRSTKNKRMAVSGLLVLAALLFIFHFRHAGTWKPSVEPGAGGALPLFAAGDKPMKINLKGLDLETGKWADFPVTIRESKSVLNQVKQAVLDFVEAGPRLDIPQGLSVNDVYLSPKEGAVVDISTAGLKAGSMGFYEELLFVRGLIETLVKNFPGIHEVKLLVNGADVSTLAGHYALGTTEAAAPVSSVANGAEAFNGNE
ncbi:MAG: GerMN domain-containing protein [bacterium]